VDLLHPAETLTKHRSTSCPHIYEMPNNTPKPDAVVIAPRKSVSRATVARHNTPPRLSSRPSMTWGYLTTL
jgi:hypothetical protein